MEIRQSSTAFFRCMGNIIWSSFRHSFKTTLINWQTGKVIGHFTTEELQGLQRYNNEENEEAEN